MTLQMQQGAQASADADSLSKETTLPLLTQLRLGITRNYYSVANAFGFKRLQDILQGTSFALATGEDVWLLGEKYTIADEAENKELHEQVMTALLMDFASKLWMSYRKCFAPLGVSGLTSDAGWGCTLRSGQMLLAQVLLHHIHGRQWRRSSFQAAPEQHAEVAQLLAWFWDSPKPEHPFSLHNLVTGGKQDGIVAGEWLGPWTLCHMLHHVVNDVQPAGLKVHLANTPGGSAPVLYTASVEELFSSNPASLEGENSKAQQGVLLLVPLVLGIGKVNPRYVPQLQNLLQWPQSAGIVGGRPSSSLYFVGFQGHQIIYLDPHEVQEVGAAPQEVLHTYFSSKPRMMPFASIDPSLAIAFYCRSLDSFTDLVSRLQTLEERSEGAPILNIVKGLPPPLEGVERCLSIDEEAIRGEEPWELLSRD